jgi:hypothetical protein
MKIAWLFPGQGSQAGGHGPRASLEAVAPRAPCSSAPTAPSRAKTAQGAFARAPVLRGPERGQLTLTRTRSRRIVTTSVALARGAARGPPCSRRRSRGAASSPRSRAGTRSVSTARWWRLGRALARRRGAPLSPARAGPCRPPCPRARARWRPSWGSTSTRRPLRAMCVEAIGQTGEVRLPRELQRAGTDRDRRPEPPPSRRAIGAGGCARAARPSRSSRERALSLRADAPRGASGSRSGARARDDRPAGVPGDRERRRRAERPSAARVKELLVRQVDGAGALGEARSSAHGRRWA